MPDLRERGVRLGVDVGSVRIGVALSDPDGILATPVATVTPVAVMAATPTTHPVNLPTASRAAPPRAATGAAAPMTATSPIAATTGPTATAKRADAENEALAVDPTDVAMRMLVMAWPPAV